MHSLHTRNTFSNKVWFLTGKFWVYKNPQDSQPYPGCHPTDTFTQAQTFPISIIFPIVTMSLCYDAIFFEENVVSTTRLPTNHTVFNLGVSTIKNPKLLRGERHNGVKVFRSLGSIPTRAAALSFPKATLRRLFCFEFDATLEAMTKEKKKSHGSRELLTTKMCQGLTPVLYIYCLAPSVFFVRESK